MTAPSNNIRAKWQSAAVAANADTTIKQVSVQLGAKDAFFMIVEFHRKLNKGLAADASLIPLKPKYWLEMLDTRHRVGLTYYHDRWQQEGSDEPFFFWLDHGSGAQLDLPECPRAKLERSTVQYFTDAEREAHEIVVDADKRLRWKQSGELVNSIGLCCMACKANKMIWVMDENGRMFAHEKCRGTLQHSSFLGGAPVRCAGMMIVRRGKIVMINGWSGHYKPTQDSLQHMRDAIEQRGIVMGKPRHAKRLVPCMPKMVLIFRRSHALERSLHAAETACGCCGSGLKKSISHDEYGRKAASFLASLYRVQDHDEAQPHGKDNGDEADKKSTAADDTASTLTANDTAHAHATTSTKETTPDFQFNSAPHGMNGRHVPFHGTMHRAVQRVRHLRMLSASRERSIPYSVGLSSADSGKASSAS